MSHQGAERLRSVKKSVIMKQRVEASSITRGGVGNCPQDQERPKQCRWREAGHKGISIF